MKIKNTRGITITQNAATIQQNNLW